MSFPVQMAIKPVLVAPTDAGLQESLTFVAKRLRPMSRSSTMGWAGYVVEWLPLVAGSEAVPVQLDGQEP